MTEICCIGHITRDKVVTPVSEVQMPGGTAYYFSTAISKLDVSFLLITALSSREEHFVSELRKKGITVKAFPSTHTVYFENIYGNDPDERTQRVLQKADPFSREQLLAVDARIYHLGPLLADDITPDLVTFLSEKGMVSLDVQGYLREVRGRQVYARRWQEMKETLCHVSILKANDAELKVLTGCDDIYEGSQMLAEIGVKEVITTLGSKGSLIYSEGNFCRIPAFKPQVVTDATGCGDTYMAGYLYKRVKEAGVHEAGEFAAAMATLKIEAAGPFQGSGKEVEALLLSNRRQNV